VSSARNEQLKNEEVASLCAEIVRRIKTEEDPVALNEYRSAIRKSVPFFVRSYFAAFLLKQLHEAAPRGDRKPQADRKRHREVRESSVPAPARKAESPRREEPHRREEPPRRSLPDEEAATLFIGVGRNRRAYARELLAFIIDNAQIEVDAVGELRVLDNFSFVQIRKEAADSVIERLNGVEFRGRAVSVSYAKPRKDDARAEQPEERGPGSELEASVHETENADVSASEPEDHDAVEPEQD
jgi:hypothetical protein